VSGSREQADRNVCPTEHDSGADIPVCRTIAAVTVGRSDFGIYRPILHAIEADPRLHLHLVCGGAHLSAEFGRTEGEITAEGLVVADRVDLLLSNDSPEAIAKSSGLGTIGFAQVFARVKPDLVLVLGDRFEMHAAALAAVPFGLPIAHVHGGEVTEGAIDDALRHAITKYAHLHFVATETFARRVIQLGEEPWRVTVSGAPALDNLGTIELAGREELERRLDLSFDRPPVLVTYHPVTRQFDDVDAQVTELLAALEHIDRPIVITKPNADTNGRRIIGFIENFAASRSNVRVVDNLGTRGYFGLMRIGGAMVGNSSSGIIEAASFGLPVVNVGIRQKGRPASANVLSVGNGRTEIAAAIATALSDDFRDRVRDVGNVYGDGRATARIVERLATVPLDETLRMKRFHDLHTDEEANFTERPHHAIRRSA
jgi:UDP-hydrolysing UDP-N-acetyl-D-glucosamine 2-epimerase